MIALTALIACWILQAYSDERGLRVPLHFAPFFGWILGASVGQFWEFVEFVGDWFGNTDLQKSNADTMTDMIANDIGALVAAVIASYVYFHVLGREQKREMGRIGQWMAHAFSVFL